MEQLLAFLADYALELGGGAAALTITETVFKPFRRLFGKTETVKLDEDTKAALAPVATAAGETLSVAGFIRMRRELKADLETELEQADTAEKDQLRARIAELESQIANPESSLKQAQKRIRDLEDILERAGNEIGGDRIAEARVALEQGDYSIADALFAEIEAREQMAVENAARAAFGRGEVAEAEVRWADAAAHYARAASLCATYVHLFKASNFALLAGDFATGLRFAQEMEGKARAEGDKSNLSLALDRAATAFLSSGNYVAAEPLFREALALDGELEGKETENYATGLNNLAAFLKATGRDEEAEPLYREAMEIDRKTVGEAHPDYAIDLNNLAGLLKATGRYEEAEPLYREALAVLETALGADHPTTKTVAGNLERFLANRP